MGAHGVTAYSRKPERPAKRAWSYSFPPNWLEWKSKKVTHCANISFNANSSHIHSIYVLIPDGRNAFLFVDLWRWTLACCVVSVAHWQCTDRQVVRGGILFFLFLLRRRTSNLHDLTKENGTHEHEINGIQNGKPFIDCHELLWVLKGALSRLVCCFPAKTIQKSLMLTFTLTENIAKKSRVS